MEGISKQIHRRAFLGPERRLVCDPLRNFGSTLFGGSIMTDELPPGVPYRLL